MAEMTVDKIKKALGVTSDAQMATKLHDLGWGCTPPLMTQWRKKGVPLGRQCWFELITDGQLRVDRRLLKGRTTLAAQAGRSPR